MEPENHRPEGCHAWRLTGNRISEHVRLWRCVTSAIPVGMVRNCTGDEGGPFEAGDQEQASSHRKLLSSRATVVNVAGKPGRRFRQAWLREASASKPPMKCRNRIRRCQNRGLAMPLGSARGEPGACPNGIRHVGGATLNQALVWNVRTCSAMARERRKRRKPRGRSTDAPDRGGLLRSSGDAGVMPVERREQVTEVGSGQPETGGTRYSTEGGSLRTVARAG